MIIMSVYSCAFVFFIGVCVGGGEGGGYRNFLKANEGGGNTNDGSGE